MNGAEAVWDQVEQFRRERFAGALASLPVDVFTVAELELHLDVIPFDDLYAKYGVDAALLQDLSGVYVDAEAYQLLEQGPVWKHKRLRFTFAHELGHYVMHGQEAARRPFPDFEAFFRWMREDSPERYRLEQAANEFAGRLLVPRDRLAEDYDKFARRAASLAGNWQTLPDLRRALADTLSDKYGVNSQVLEVRLDREGIWLVQ